MSLEYYVIDTETNGIKSGYHTMTEISIIRCTDRVQLSKNIICETPERSSIDALNITKKTLADLAKGYAKEDVVEKCEKFFMDDKKSSAHRCIVAHNAAFDRRFLWALWDSCGRQFPASLWLDTIALTRQFIKNAGLNETAKQNGDKKLKVNLQAACDIVGIKKIPEMHTAKSDSRNTYLLWKDLIDIKKIDYLPHIQNIPHSLKIEDEPDMSLLD
jgi:DNA polymerase III epsilon subunit-like protein